MAETIVQKVPSLKLEIGDRFYLAGMVAEVTAVFRNKNNDEVLIDYIVDEDSNCGGAFYTSAYENMEILREVVPE